jgi:hypothetical protein
MGFKYELSHSPVRMKTVQVLLTWHSSLYERHPIHKKASYHCIITGEV